MIVAAMTAALVDGNEKERVESHRRTFFREILGEDTPADDIEELVHSNVSPHEARALKDKGWPSEYIVKVLL